MPGIGKTGEGIRSPVACKPLRHRDDISSPPSRVLELVPDTLYGSFGQFGRQLWIDAFRERGMRQGHEDITDASVDNVELQRLHHHRESPAPSRCGAQPAASAGPAAVFLGVLRIRALDPAFGTLPADAVAFQRGAHRLTGDASTRQPLGTGHLGEQLECPETGRMAKVAR